MRARVALVVLVAGCQPDYAIHPLPVDVHPAEVTECAFEVVEGAPEVERYTCNPVFVASGEPWAKDLSGATFLHTNVLDHPFYQLWYFAAGDGAPQGGYATSPDGTTWAAHPDNPSWPAAGAGGWDGGHIQMPAVAWHAGLDAYLMLYGGVSKDLSFFGLGVATSIDGHTWAKSPTNPIVDLRLPFGGTQIAWPMTLTVDADGATWAYMGATADGEHIGMWRFETDDPTAWLNPGEEVLDVGKAGAFDDQGFGSAAIAELDGVQYMFYVGFGDWLVDEASNVRSSQDAFLGVATSRDGGRTWKRDRTDPLPIHVDPKGFVSAVAAQTVGSRILLWVTDHYTDIDENAVGYFVYTPGGAAAEEGT